MKLSIIAIGIGIFSFGYIASAFLNVHALVIGAIGIVVMVALLIVENKKPRK